MGATLGVGLSSEFRHYMADFYAHWPPILQAQSDGVLDPDSLSQDDREYLQRFNVPVMLAWGQAMLDWPGVEPADLRCLTLWLVGSEDRVAMLSVREYEQALEGSNVQLHIVDGLEHRQIFEEIDRVFATMLAFIQT